MRRKRRRAALATIAVLAGLALFLALVAQAGTQARSDDEDKAGVRGAGTTIVEGGTGTPSFTPLLTKVAFHARNGSGRFECLALAPGSSAGDLGSGDFDTNVMYVTGEITSAKVRDNVATLTGTATVTGVGAGSNEPFTAALTRGGPGATLVLEVSGLTFREILLDGEFRF
ncbi:MAG TPA: hypothetical protein VFR38_08110 [Gaiellaceae bacterium]|nr:hypothetical protein [Gaiellaceae bacterium]